ncbi:synaptopodin-2 [Pungitius pungitius]|uniref:synaptopodin-2 n=1 Tax=Pungitius pungitius TaxID=134920 RepID=UPI002E1217AC
MTNRAGPEPEHLHSKTTSEMEPEDPDHSDKLVPWSGSDGSEELCEDASDEEYPSDPLPAHILESDLESPARPQSRDWESAGEQQSPPELSESEEELSYKEEDDVYLSESNESITESPRIQPSLTSLSTHTEGPNFEPQAGRTSRPPSHSSSISLDRAADMTLALTLTTEQPLGASRRQGPGTLNRSVESSEEGGSSEAPPASLFFGIPDKAAERAEKCNSESDTDLCRPDRQRAKSKRLSHNESQSERNVKETKSKCKRIARLLTDAPNPQNKGALLFEKRRQRVKKYTLVSYGTGEKRPDSEDPIEEETGVRSSGYNFVATSESEFEEDYSIYQQQHNLSRDWGSGRDMEALPDTKGKGVEMFAQCRKRIDEIGSEQDELRNKGLHLEFLQEPECRERQNVYDTEEMYVHTDPANYMDADRRQQDEYRESIQQMNNLSNVPRPLVPNRTAKPFLGFPSRTAPVVPGGLVPVTKRQEPRFRVPVPINTNPQVWSPTGDIIASRDERISVPAIKTGILPESKRKGTNKQPRPAQGSDQHLQNKGERRSFIESEEDCFSLGAEACNFMQPRTIKLKNPPPVAPKPTINPACPPWMSRSPSGGPYIQPRSPVPQTTHGHAGPHNQHYLQQQDWAQAQQMANYWKPDQTLATLQTPANAWEPVNSSSQLHLQPATNSWNQQPSQPPVSMQGRGLSYSPHHPPTPSRNNLDSTLSSVESCPPQAGKSNGHATKASPASPRGRVSDRGSNRAADGPPMAGKGAELFAKRQSRMEKFVVDAETVHANKARSPSPTASLPNTWRYSSIVRAPPPLSYNPLHAPFYPPSAAKQPPSTSPKIKPKTKEKPKAAPRPLNPLDIMKHQPYQLDSSLFKYEAVPEAKSPSPKPTPASKFEVIKSLKHRSVPSHSPDNASERIVQSKAQVPAKSPVSVSSHNSSTRQSTRSVEPLATDRRLDEKHTVTPAAPHITNKQAPSARPASASSQHSSVGESIASAYSPASLIARGARQMAPRPKYSARKPVVTGKQWRPVAALH